MNVEKAILSVYPKALECAHGHAESKLSFYEEQDDDRINLMILARCSRCSMPVGGEDYATSDNRDRFYAGKEPLEQFECKHGWCRQATTDAKYRYCSLHPAKKIEVVFI